MIRVWRNKYKKWWNSPRWWIIKYTCIHAGRGELGVYEDAHKGRNQVVWWTGCSVNDKGIKNIYKGAMPGNPVVITINPDELTDAESSQALYSVNLINEK